MQHSYTQYISHTDTQILNIQNLTYLPQMIFKVDDLLCNLVPATWPVSLSGLQPPYVHLIGRVRALTVIDVTPGIAVSIVIAGCPQIGMNVSTVNL